LEEGPAKENRQALHERNDRRDGVIQRENHQPGCVKSRARYVALRNKESEKPGARGRQRSRVGQKRDSSHTNGKKK